MSGSLRGVGMTAGSRRPFDPGPMRHLRTVSGTRWDELGRDKGPACRSVAFVRMAWDSRPGGMHMQGEHVYGQAGYGDGSAVARLAEFMEELKVRSGRSYQALARRAGLSSSTLHRYCTGKIVPTDGRVLRYFAKACGVGSHEETTLLHLWNLVDVTQQRPVRVSAPPAAAWRSRCDLPRGVHDFTGRAAELRRLLVTPAEVTVINGMAGVGKTTLAVHAAHRLADRYPDGQLFVDLHGHTAGVDPVTPLAGLGLLLQAVGVPADQVPCSVEQRASLWRSTVAGRKVLVVLDNAIDERQTQPLVPGHPGCRTLITSRHRLVDVEDADILTLDVLSTGDVVELCGRILGREGVHIDRSAAEETSRLCGRLPLAVRIATARLRRREAWTAEHLNERLRREHHRLGELRAGSHSVAAAFALSYHKLTSEQQKVFRLIGLLPGADMDAPVVADTAQLPVARAERLLEDLVDAHLLQQPAVGRYRLHDLVREHARQTALDEETTDGVTTALTRTLDHYLCTAEGAAELLEPSRRASGLSMASPSAHAPVLADRAEAMDWLDSERVNLISVIDQAVTSGLFEHAWQLARALWHFFLMRGNNEDWIRTHELALTAARHADDQPAEAETLKNLGLALWW
ncbi:ATP-binding protein, partial [Actinophytocola sp.]|uniref:ATP-binding protein n=1 Tax=Actinophytocola sp. TaxID=1872138 RepID=UPI00389997CB